MSGATPAWRRRWRSGPTSAPLPGLALGLFVACGSTSSWDDRASTDPSRLEVEVSVSDGESPVAGVEIWRDKARLAVTPNTGVARLRITGEEGQRVELTVRCPEGFVSPAAPLRFALRSLSESSRLPRFESSCARTAHRIVVGLRATGGRDLPIYHLDQIVGRTDAFGVAHVALSVLPAQQVTLTLDTGQQPRLLPHSPKLTFVAPERSELVLIEQKFSLEKAPAKAPKRVVHGPQRL